MGVVAPIRPCVLAIIRERPSSFTGGCLGLRAVVLVHGRPCSFVGIRSCSRAFVFVGSRLGSWAVVALWWCGGGAVGGWWWLVVVGPRGRLRSRVVGAPCCHVAVFVLSSCLCRGPCIWCEADMTKGGSYLPQEPGQ